VAQLGNDRILALREKNYSERSHKKHQWKPAPVFEPEYFFWFEHSSMVVIAAERIGALNSGVERRS
jgi:hypothetical protein